MLLDLGVFFKAKKKDGIKPSYTPEEGCRKGKHYV
tara:strand:- start:1224 stop:1328 length:105 start_codon:yes stop_codon:yes gene_type:complete